MPMSDDQLCDPCKGRRSLFSTLALPCACSPWSRGLADLPQHCELLRKLNHTVCIQGQVGSVLHSAQRHNRVHLHSWCCSVLLALLLPCCRNSSFPVQCHHLAESLQKTRHPRSALCILYEQLLLIHSHHPLSDLPDSLVT